METYVILDAAGGARAADLEGGRRPVDRRRQPHAGRHPLDPQLRAQRRPTARVGTVCMYQASSPEAIGAHAERAGPAGGRDHRWSPTPLSCGPIRCPSTASRELTMTGKERLLIRAGARACGGRQRRRPAPRTPAGAADRGRASREAHDHYTSRHLAPGARRRGEPPELTPTPPHRATSPASGTCRTSARWLYHFVKGALVGDTVLSKPTHDRRRWPSTSAARPELQARRARVHRLPRKRGTRRPGLAPAQPVRGQDSPR